MIGWLIAGAIGAIILGVVLWETFAPFIKDVVEHVRESFGKLFRSFRCFIKRVWGKFIGIVRSFIEELNLFTWKKTGRTWTKEEEHEVPEEEVPEDIRARVYREEEVDVTDNEELRLAVGM